MPPSRDASIIQRLKNLDRQTIGEVYDRYFPEVYRYALYRLGEGAQAEDVASDVFVRLLETLEKGGGPSDNLKGWLLATAAHIIADFFRRKYRRGEEEIPEELPDPQPSLDETTDERARRRQALQALQTLTAEQQEVIALRFGQGYSLEETAALMKKNANAVKALQFRALAALNRELGEAQE
ncbi:MAG: sigma-70 family RNA polymerase sigma factor [Anaerolineales bacterium]